MSAKPTPGPWGVWIEGVDQQGGESHCIVAGAHFAAVANVPFSSVGTTHGEPGQTVISEEEAIANARLIGAAPTLLAELRHAARLLAEAANRCRSVDIEGDRFDLLAEAERLDAVVAKAGGAT